MRSTTLLVLLFASTSHADAPPQPPTVTIGIEFPGEEGTAQSAADPGGGAGADQELDVVAGAVTMRDVNGYALATSTADAFWTAAGITGTPAASAQHAIFDAANQRWYVSAEQATTTTPNQIYVAISQSGDVMSSWKAIALPPQAAMITNTHLAVDAAGVYVTGDMAGQSIVMALPLEDLQWTGSAGPTANHLNVLTVPHSGLVPAIDPNEALISWSRMFIARDVLASGNTAIDVYRLSWDGSVLGTQQTATLSEPDVVDLGIPYQAPSRPAVQPSPSPRLDPGTGALASASSDGHHVVGVATIMQSSHLATLWFELDVDPSTPTIKPQLDQQGVVEDSADLIAPAIAMDSDGSFGLVMVRVSALDPPAIAVTGQGNGDGPGSMRALVIQPNSGEAYSCNPVSGVSAFGRYSSIVSTAGGFSAVAQTGASRTNCAFRTSWVNFQVPSSVVPPNPGGDGADGGFGDQQTSPPAGCGGCASAGGALAWPVGLVGLALLRRRRRSRA